MSGFGEADDPRRRLLIQALAAGVFSGTAAGSAMAQQLFGSTPSKLPAGRSIYRIVGQATVDGKPATIETRILPTSVIETIGRDSELVFANGDNAFIMRGNSRMVLENKGPDPSILSGLSLFAGRLLSVFAKKKDRLQMTTRTASIGIRGTGVYMESDPEQTYFCTCYGIADVEASNDPQSKDTVIAKHHDRPLYILNNAPAGKNIRPAPFINHTDQELMLIETLVGRTPPFVFPKDDYSGPRRNY